MEDKKCKKNFPMDTQSETKLNENGFVDYRRRTKEDGGNEGTLLKKDGSVECVVDNRWVVTYNPYLLEKFDCHINVVFVSSTGLPVKYVLWQN